MDVMVYEKTNSGTIEAYNKMAKAYSKDRADSLFWLEEFRTFQRLVPGKRVIDIGCGNGRDTPLFIENHFDYTGIDASEGLLAIARKRFKDARFLLMDFYGLDFPLGTFDCFWATASLLHVPKKKISDVLLSIRRIIKGDGVGFISLKEKRSAEEETIKHEKYGGAGRFFAFYTLDEFSDILRKSGFSTLKSHIKPGRDTRWLCYFVRKS